MFSPIKGVYLFCPVISWGYNENVMFALTGVCNVLYQIKEKNLDTI